MLNEMLWAAYIVLEFSPTLVFVSLSQGTVKFLSFSLLISFCIVISMRVITFPLFLFAAGVFALPPNSVENSRSDSVERGNGQIRFPVPDSMTIKEAQAKCGDQAQLSCCNHATYAGDTTDVNSGILAGTLSHIAGTGSGASGLGLFDQCSQLDVQGMFISSDSIMSVTNVQ
jgi:hypothetical protein